MIVEILREIDRDFTMVIEPEFRWILRRLSVLQNGVAHVVTEPMPGALVCMCVYTYVYFM